MFSDATKDERADGAALADDTDALDENGDSATASAARPAALKARHPMELLLKTGKVVQLPKVGSVIEGTVIGNDSGKLFVDLGAAGTGIIYGREYYAAQSMIKNLAPGEKITAKVVEFDNDEGYTELSLKEAGTERRWSELKRIRSEGAPVDLVVKKANSGGLILECSGVEGFMPASQLAQAHYPRVEGGEKEKILGELQKLVGQTLKVKILDLNPDESKLIFTEKWVDEEEARRLLANYKIGDVVEGRITGVVDFGAFMTVADTGLEGLVHLSEIDWTLIENPRDVLKVGETVKAKIIDIQGDKISLSLKQLKEDPWLKLAERYKKGDRAKGTVTKINHFGAFVHLGGGVQGLIHVSEFGGEDAMRSALTVGKEYEFTITLLEPKDHKMYLSLRPAAASPEAKPAPGPTAEQK